MDVKHLARSFSVLLSAGILSIAASCDEPAFQLRDRLSQTGAFADVRTLQPAAGFLAYDVNVPFWSDGATKQRWMKLPAGQQIKYAATQPWKFPVGTVFIKHFQLDDQRIETRLLLVDADGVHGATYKWRGDRSDADLVSNPINANGWDYPGREDCRTCHTPASGGVLGVRTSQINREHQLENWQARGLFDVAPDVLQSATLARADDLSRSIEDRARSYLDANCANCHRPDGVAGNFDARFETPLARQNLIDGNVLINLGLDHARTIAPHDVWRSVALVRIETTDRTRMPPLAHEKIDHAGAELIREWIASLPGKDVLAPPMIEPKGGNFTSSQRITLSAKIGTIHYTVDGALPTKSSPIYSQPIEISEPTTLRARVFGDPQAPSICVQETFIVTR